MDLIESFVIFYSSLHIDWVAIGSIATVVAAIGSVVAARAAARSASYSKQTSDEMLSERLDTIRPIMRKTLFHAPDASVVCLNVRNVGFGPAYNVSVLKPRGLDNRQDELAVGDTLQGEIRLTNFKTGDIVLKYEDRLRNVYHSVARSQDHRLVREFREFLVQSSAR